MKYILITITLMINLYADKYEVRAETLILPKCENDNYLIICEQTKLIKINKELKKTKITKKLCRGKHNEITIIYKKITNKIK